ncbi:GATA zinc finger domain-containing protein 10-like isoform X2 [Cucumis melo var. makuwa]|uniref:GATA zinc finger domain-containing protein 10-like isoform X2 n=2 Tax=Cucumis melo TaxID=3656 RepID=A0A5A7V3V8_CUCMM|nr:GATA zinc finger domain-containing protein 10-like isoform X2 [Cucumis melo var. makuwa]
MDITQEYIHWYKNITRPYITQSGAAVGHLRSNNSRRRNVADDPQQRRRALVQELDQLEEVDQHVKEVSLVTQTQSEHGYAGLSSSNFGQQYYDLGSDPSSSYMHGHECSRGKHNEYLYYKVLAAVLEQSNEQQQQENQEEIQQQRVYSRRRQPAENCRHLAPTFRRRGCTSISDLSLGLTQPDAAVRPSSNRVRRRPVALRRVEAERVVGLLQVAKRPRRRTPKTIARGCPVHLGIAPFTRVDLLSVDSIEGHNQVSGKGFPTIGPQIEAGNVVIHRGLHCTLRIDASFGITRLIRASFGITRLICASFGITRLICASFGITRLICASLGISRLIGVSFGITRLIRASFGITGLMCAFYGTDERQEGCLKAIWTRLVFFMLPLIYFVRIFGFVI